MRRIVATKWILSSLLALQIPASALAQTFSSGSTGSDGALTFTTPGTYVFDPKTYNPALNPAGDNVFNFTTITIASGVTVKLSGAVFNAPIFWLAQGAVKIDGTLDLSGQDGFNASNTTQRTLATPGAGGYGGGYPAVGNNPAGSGLGPAAGGSPSVASCGGYAASGGFTGNQYLVPLIGGSGGGGADSYSGGAGGGAILIASSASVSGAGSINASGGARSQYAGAGGGGGIRLVAPSVTITGALNAAAGGSTYCPVGSPTGIIRVEAFNVGALNIAGGTLYTATPFGLFLSPAGQPSLRVLTVGGNAVAALPTGTFTIPDVTVNSNNPLTVAIQAANVPVGTVATLVIFSENGPDQTILSTPLAGNLASSTATASVTLPSGFSKGFIKASFTQ